MARAQILGLVIAPLAVFLLNGHVARADCEWPPLNAREARESTPVTVGGQTFTTGFYSWWVEHYHIDQMNCTDSVRIGPWEWTATVGLGGAEPIGPRISSEAATDSAAPQPAVLPPLTPVRPLDELSTQSLLPLNELPSLETLPGTR